MFVDLVLKFCCSKRPRPEQEGLQPRGPREESQQEPRVSPSSQQQFSFTAYFDAQRQNQQNEVRIKTEVQPADPNFNKQKLATSLEKNNPDANGDPSSPTDQYLVFGEVRPQMNSLEDIQGPQQMQIEVHASLVQTMQPPQQNAQQREQVIRRSTSTQTFEQSTAPKKVSKKIKKERAPQEEQRRVKIWDQEEDNQLRKHYYESNGNWKTIAQMIPGRNMNQCAQRWRRLNPQPCKQKWTFEDDQRIMALVKSNGRNWMEISKHFPGKTGKQIRERFLNKLDPSLRVEAWTKDEDAVILDMYKTQGPKWSVIAAKLRGRSENMVKNRFYSYIRRVELGKQNPYQIVMNPALQRQSSVTADMESPFSNRQTPYSENGSYSSGTGTNFSFYESIQAENEHEQENELEFVEDPDFHAQFVDQCNIESNGHESSQFEY